VTNLSIRAFVAMTSFVASFKERLAEERGQDLIEYAMLGGLLAVAIAAVLLTPLKTALTDMATGIGDCIDFDNTGCNAFK
jgi:Flp pilus assembly pilin Flp